MGTAAAQWKKLATEHAPPGTAPCVKLLGSFVLQLPAPCSDFMPADVARRSGQMCDTKVGELLYTGSETWLFADGDWTCALLRSRLTLLPRELTARARIVRRQQTQGVQPPGRGATALTRFGEGALMFGGESSTGMLGDTWTWTAARGWTELQPSACRRCPDEGSPQNRSMHSLATLTMSGRDGELVILFGGATTGVDHLQRPVVSAASPWSHWD